MARHLTVFLAALVSLKASFSAAAITDYQKEREVYQQAAAALQAKNLTNYRALRATLEQYPLAAYLDYSELKSRFARLPADEVQQFLDTHNNGYITQRLRNDWLNYLGLQRQWRLYNAFYQPTGNETQQCFHLRAQLATGADRQEVFGYTTHLWLSESSLPKACDPLFASWRSAGYQTADLSWQRFELAYAAGNHTLASYLRRFLPPKQQQTALRLLKAERYADQWLTEMASPMPATALSPATRNRLLIRLSASHYQQIAELLENYELHLSQDELAYLKRLTAWYMAKESPELAQQWLARHLDKAMPELTESLLRYALQEKNWASYMAFYQHLTPAQQQEPEWRYWYAEAQLQTQLSDDHQPAARILYDLAQQRNYYGFLAAEKIQMAPRIYTERVEPIAEISAKVHDKLAAALEFFYLNDLQQANQVWYFNSLRFSKQEWQQAAALASDAGWYARAIASYAKAGLWNHVDARFPLAFADIFSTQASHNQIEPSWLLAMARQESGFSAHARSSRGALGVLQLMPATAKKLANELQMDFNKEKLLDPAYNIQLASEYLKNLLADFNNNYILATAAYNAGPNRVKEWLSERPFTDDWAHWVATIPYQETRNYVQNILAYSKIYQNRLEEQDVSLNLAGLLNRNTIQ